MATTFSQAKSGLDDVARRVHGHRSQMQQIKALATGAATDLAAMAQTYATLIADIDAAVAGSPNNVALQLLRDEKNLLVAEFQQLKTKADQFKAAVDPITF